MHKAYIGMGTNVGDLRKNIDIALAELNKVAQVIRCSSLYETKPWGKTDQADFLNAVVQVATAVSPHELLDSLMAIETKMGRERYERWGPRTMDLDLLTFDHIQLNDADLKIPHPALLTRAFVMVPLVEIDPSYNDMLKNMDQESLDGVKKLQGTVLCH